jgi:hypothetical protein
MDIHAAIGVSLDVNFSVFNGLTREALNLLHPVLRLDRILHDLAAANVPAAKRTADEVRALVAGILASRGVPESDLRVRVLVLFLPLRRHFNLQSWIVDAIVERGGLGQKKRRTPG